MSELDVFEAVGSCEPAMGLSGLGTIITADGVEEEESDGEESDGDAVVVRGKMLSKTEATDVFRSKTLCNCIESQMIGRQTETPLETYRRLTDETQKLHDVLKRQSESPVDHVALLKQVESLHAEIATIGSSHATLLDRIEPSSSSDLRRSELLKTLQTFKHADPTGKAQPGLTYELYLNAQTSPVVHRTKVSELETRLTTLERIVGVTRVDPLNRPMSADEVRQSLFQTSGSLVGAMERIHLSLSLLTDPVMLDRLTRRMKTAIKHLETLFELKKKQRMESKLITSTGNTTDTQIEYLYNTLSQLEPCANAIPLIASRLKALQSLHNDAAVFSESLAALNEDQKQVKDAAKALQEGMARLVHNMQLNEAAVLQNMEAIEKRIKKNSS